MDQREVTDLLIRHHRRRPWFWLCVCGFRHPCPPRRLALEEHLKLETRARMEVVMEDLRRRAEHERNQRAMSPVEPGANAIRWWR